MAPLLLPSFLLFGISLAAPTSILRPAEDNLSRDAVTLQTFAKSVTSDPNSTVASWAGPDVCIYTGVKCSTRPDGVLAVSGLDINQANLSSSDLRLSSLLDSLPDITFFHANTNNFVGSIPSLSDLKYLYELDLSNNHLSGDFPNTVFDTPLSYLDLRFNDFSGPLPDQLFQPFGDNLSLDVVFLNNNQFSGGIPETGDIQTRYITLANNQLEGEIPESFGRNAELKELVLKGNKLVGSLPESLCALDLDVLDVSANAGLEGKLGPKCLGLLKSGVLDITETGLVE